MTREMIDKRTRFHLSLPVEQGDSHERGTRADQQGHEVLRTIRFSKTGRIQEPSALERPQGGP